MSAKTDPTAKPTRSDVRWRFAVGGLILLVAGILVARGHKVDDAALTQALVGSWTAVDPSDASLHRREVPVTGEQLVIRDDGTLTHVVALASDPEHPDKDPYGWKVSKGRLYVRFMGEDASGQWLTGFSFSVSDDALSIHIKDHPPKRWVRR